MQGRDDIARIASARAVEIASRAISLASSVKGEKGDKGEPGEIVLKNVPVPGEKGEQGEKGERGYTGAQGPKGDKGDKGDRGTDAVGAKGDKGDKGETGPQGERGFTGPKGFKGDEGERGLTGPIPKHEIKGLKFRFQQDDGDWGKWIIVPTGGGGGGRDDKLFDRQKELVIIADAYKNNTNPFPDATGAAQVYPGAGIPNSTGSAWGTSYGVTGTGSVVLNSNPVFATDITVNGVTTGKGFGSIVSNTAFGVNALSSPKIQSGNINNVGIGNNTLSALDVGVATITVTNGGSGYNDDGSLDFTYQARCTFVSGTAATVYPGVTLTVTGGVITSAVVDPNGGFSDVYGYGFTLGATTTMTVPDYSGYGGGGVILNVGTYYSATNNTAVGYLAGSTNRVSTNSVYIGSGATGTGSNSVYLGYGATGTGTNEIVIGANATGLGDNTVVIGNGSITNTALRGSVIIPSATIAGALNATGGLSLTGQTSTNSSFHTNQSTANITIGGASGTGAITLGRSTNAQTVQIGGTGNIVTVGGATGTGALTFGQSNGNQTVNIATGVNIISTKTLNLGTGGTGGTNNINIGPTGTVNGQTTINIGTQARTSNPTTVNIGTNATGGNSNITLGSIGAATLINSNGIFQQRIYTSINLQPATAGRKAFVSDHRSNSAYPVFGEAYSTSGTFGNFNVPVFADGTIWRVG